MKKLASLFCALLIAALPMMTRLSKAATTVGPNLITNSSMETTSGLQPANWQTFRTGTATALYTHERTGKTGARSTRVTAARYTSGAVAWVPSAQINVQAGQTYRYTDAFKGNGNSKLYIQTQSSTGAVNYVTVQTQVGSSTAWKATTSTFTVPAGTVKMRVFHGLNRVGWLQVDDVFLGQVTETPTPNPNPNPNPVPGNMLTNPSMETVDPANATKPLGWASNKWGTNTATFSYEQTGAQNGTRSVKTTVSSLTNGDAKWTFEPVAVTASKTYVAKHYYKSTVETQLLVGYINSAGVYTFEWMRSVPVSAAWQEVGVSFTPPAGTVKASIFHVLDKVGSLQLDNASLAEQAAVPITSMIPNNSLEVASSTNAAMPADWTASSWGNNTSVFTYENQGRTGGKSAKVTMSNYVDGDAKWYFNPIKTLTPGKQYRFTGWYKGNVAPEVVAMLNKADGTTQYFGMPKPTPAANAPTTWQQYSDTFSVPAGTESVSVFMFINKNGWIQVDDFGLSEYQPTGFSRPLVTLTFDDGHEDNVANALPLLNQLGLKTTQCYATEYVEGIPSGIAGVRAFFDSGHEICSHTVSHPFLTQVTPTQLDHELRHSKEVLEGIIGQPVRNFASPFGDYNQGVNDVIDNYYQSHRTVDEGYNSKDNFNIYRLRVQNIKNTTTAAEVQAWLDHARATNTWLVLVYHRVAADAGQFDSFPADFAAQMQAVKNSGLTVKTYQDALTEVRSQL